MYVSHETIPSCCASHKEIWIREGDFYILISYMNIHDSYDSPLQKTSL